MASSVPLMHSAQMVRLIQTAAPSYRFRPTVIMGSGGGGGGGGGRLRFPVVRATKSSTADRHHENHHNALHVSREAPSPSPPLPLGFIVTEKKTVRTKRFRTTVPSAARWFLGFGQEAKLPAIVKAGDPVLHEPAVEVEERDISSERIQKVIDDMVEVMRKGPGVGLAAPQIGIPLRIIVLEDTETYISYVSKAEIKAQDRKPFELMVIINPKLTKKGDKTALFFEGCLSVDGFRALVERHLEVEVTGFGRHGKPIKIEAVGWKARILQHECDHLDGTIYVDKMVPRTFRTVENMSLPLPAGSPTPGVQ